MDNLLPILYTFRRCPYAMRARLALAASGLAFEWREILLRDKPAHMLEVSPKGTVPVLALPGGQIIDESLDIMLWALSQADPMELLPQERLDGQAAYSLIARNDGPFKQHLDRYKYATRYDDVDETAERDAGFAILQDLNQRLEAQPFLAGERIGLADIAIFPFIRQFRVADKVWFDAQSLTALQAWLKARMESPAFTSIMVKRTPWKPGDLIVEYKGCGEGL